MFNYNIDKFIKLVNKVIYCTYHNILVEYNISLLKGGTSNINIIYI